VDAEVIVVDNGSTSSPLDSVKEKFPWVTFVNSEKNLGVPGGRNLGIAHSRGEYLLFMDDDAFFGISDVSGKVRKAFEKYPLCGAVAFQILDAITGKPSPGEFPGPDPEKRQVPFETTYFIGCGFALKRSVVNKTGLFLEDYFFALEELDLSMRLMDAGYSIHYAPEIIVYHAHSAVRPSGRWFEYNLRSRFILTTRFLPVWAIIPHLIIWNIFIFAKACYARHLTAFFKGFFRGFSAIPLAIRFRQPLSSTTIKKIWRLKGRLFY
ncbi:MAG: glycosyltransferase family 2 protein, partial [Syntrophales bacterium LBB04]|nr:glycosyltransferase family 2 protein [Syntrophales bacterium LBB04]